MSPGILRLPNEIIQQIFFQNFEVNLARASPLLGQSLSSEPVYKCVLLKAFWSSGEFDTIAKIGPSDELARIFLPGPVPDPKMADAERLALQERVLNCRWCTLPRLKQMYLLLLRIQFKNIFKDAFPECVPDSLEDLMNEHFILMASRYPELTPTRPRQFLISNGPTIEIDWPCDVFLRTFTSWTQPFTPAESRALLVLHIPEYLLLTQDWTADRLQMFRFLRKALYRSDFSTVSLKSEAIQIGIKNCIRTQQYWALVHLLELNDSYWAARTSKEGAPLDSEAFIMAAEKQDISAFVCLLRSNSSAIPATNQTIRNWVSILKQDKNENRNLFGSWLRKFLNLSAVGSYIKSRTRIFESGSLYTPPDYGGFAPVSPSDSPRSQEWDFAAAGLDHDDNMVLEKELQVALSVTEFKSWVWHLGYYESEMRQLTDLTHAHPEPGRDLLPYATIQFLP